MTDDQSTWTRRYRTFLGLFAQTAALLLGLYIMYAAVSSGSDRPWLYTAAIMMMGLPFAGTLNSLIHTVHSLMGELQKVSERPPKDSEEQ